MDREAEAQQLLDGSERYIRNQPRLGDGLHPSPDERNELTGPEEAEVPVAERAEKSLYFGRKMHGRLI